MREGLREPGWSGEAKATQSRAQWESTPLLVAARLAALRLTEEIRVRRGSQGTQGKSGVLGGGQGAQRKSECLEEVRVLGGISLEQQGPGAPSSSYPAIQLTHHTNCGVFHLS